MTDTFVVMNINWGVGSLCTVKDPFELQLYCNCVVEKGSEFSVFRISARMSIH